MTEGRERGWRGGGWSSWEGAAAPSPPARGSWERCELPQRSSGRSTNRPNFSTIFSTQDGLSWHYNIVNCGLSCSRWGPRSRAPCVYVPVPSAVSTTTTTTTSVLMASFQDHLGKNDGYNTIRLRFNDATAVKLPLYWISTALRPFDDIRYDQLGTAA